MDRREEQMSHCSRRNSVVACGYRAPNTFGLRCRETPSPDLRSQNRALRDEPRADLRIPQPWLVQATLTGARSGQPSRRVFFAFERLG